ISGLEEYDYPENEWDCVISNLALHYIEDIVEIFQKVYRTLKPGGIFLFNIEHPVFTAGVGQDWIYTDDGKPQYWAIDNYFITGERNTHFLGCDVVKQHHTLTQIIMGLLNNGFELKVVDLHIQISKEDLKILDLLLKANEYSNIVFYCENDEEHFIFTEVKLGNYFCINR
ncbi:methyltransferase domain-containing protein, partial [Campylobacter jejuni]